MIVVHIHTSRRPGTQISIETQANDSEPDGYPVVKIGDATWFPSDMQLAQLRDAINSHFAAPRIAHTRQTA